VVCTAEMRGTCVSLVGKHEGKYDIAKRRWRWVDNIKINLQEICWGAEPNCSVSQ